MFWANDSVQIYFDMGNEAGKIYDDNDGQGRKQGLTLGPKGTEPFGKPSIWKTVRLSAP